MLFHLFSVVCPLVVPLIEMDYRFNLADFGSISPIIGLMEGMRSAVDNLWVRTHKVYNEQHISNVQSEGLSVGNERNYRTINNSTDTVIALPLIDSNKRSN